MTQDQGRTADRIRMLRAGQIVWDNASRTMNCKVRDMSKSGARLELTDLTPLPETFELRLPPAKDLRPVQVMRRSDGGKSLGVMFLDNVFDENASEGGAIISRYDPSLAEHPLFVPISDEVRKRLPWAA